MRLIKAGWVMKPTTRISPPQRGTHEGVDFVHPADQLRPSTPEGRAVRPLRRGCPLGCLAWGGGLGRRGGLLALAPGRIRVEAVVVDRMASWVRDLHQDPG